ncbi:MAG: DUF885 domain-containing protein [Actinobacteria bacterium]|nr:DUF885 domain-containing protein [Actinomycetota bacterium]
MTTDQTSSPQVADLAERALRQLLSAEPLEGTLLGFREYDALLADISVEAEQRMSAERAALRAEAEAIDPATLTQQDAITVSLIITQSHYADAAQAAGAIEYTATAFPVTPASSLLAFLRMIVLTNAEQAAAYLVRLREIPRYLAQAEDRLTAGRTAGLLPVAHLVTMSIDQIDRFLATEPCPLDLAAPADWSAATEWKAQCAAVIDDVVKPAFRRHRDVLEADVLPTARDRDEVGLLHLPGGLDRYAGLVRLHTTTDRTPEELHQVGLDMVALIHEEFSALGATLFGLTDVRAIFEHLNNDPALRWSTSQEILDAAEKTVRRAEAASVDWFGRLPVAVCALEAIPELEAEGAPPAYYMQPALDGSRPGTYYTNVNEPTERTSFDLESVAYHEAVPGHHFQISVALELPDLPMFRRVSLFTAYVEGWGLYSERLADEMGLYSSQLQRMGMLSADVWRASRLVVDTGMHAFGWTRQQAVAYLLQNTPVAPIDVEAEIDRYIAYPGQALSYMTGRLEIQLLRARAEAALGDAFDIKEFHDVVLGSGALPLAVLGQVVDSWIQSR